MWTLLYRLFQVVSLSDGASWDLISEASRSCSFEIVSVVSDISEQSSGSLSHSFHVIPSAASSLGSFDLVPSHPSDAVSLDSWISVGSDRSRRSLLTLRSALAPQSFPADCGGSWQLLSVLCKLNVPLRGTVKSVQDFGAFVSIDATPRDLAVQNNRLLSGRGLSGKGKGKGKGKGNGKGNGKGETKILQDGLCSAAVPQCPGWLTLYGGICVRGQVHVSVWC